MGSVLDNGQNEFLPNSRIKLTPKNGAAYPQVRCKEQMPVATRKSKKRRRGRPAKPPVQALLEKKAKAFLKAEKAYWEQRQSLRHQYGALGSELSLETEHLLPPELSSTVWALQDGVAFVRHKPVKGLMGVSFRALP
jgi:hypothetical protein